MIKSLVEAGDVASAQEAILKELEVQYGNSARRARETLGGALDALQNAWGDLFEFEKQGTESWRQRIEALTGTIKEIDVSELHSDLSAIAEAALYLGGLLGTRVAIGVTAYTVATTRAAFANLSFSTSAFTASRRAVLLGSRLGLATAGAHRLAAGMHIVSRSLTVLRTGLAFLTGPTGLLFLGAYAAYEFATANDDLSESLEGLPDDIDALRVSLEGLSDAQVERTKLTLLGEIDEVKDQLTDAQEELDDLLVKQGKFLKSKERSDEALNRILRESGGNQKGFVELRRGELAAKEKERNDAIIKAQARLDDVNGNLGKLIRKNQRINAITNGEPPPSKQNPPDTTEQVTTTSAPSADDFSAVVENLKSQEQKIRERYAAQIETIRGATAEQVAALNAQGLTVAAAITAIEGKRDTELQTLRERSRQAELRENADHNKELIRQQDEVAKAFIERQEAHQESVNAINAAVLSLKSPLEQAQAAAEQWRQETLAGLDQAAEGYQRYAEHVEYVYNGRIANARREDAERTLAESTRFEDGVRRALNAYADEALDAGKLAEEATRRSLDSMSAGLGEFVSTGKLNFKDFARSVISDLAQIAARAALTNLFGSILSGFSFGGGGNQLPGLQVAHEGGIIGEISRRRHHVSPTLFAHAQRYHGGGIAGNEVPAILQRGEEVLAANHPRHQNNAGANVVVNQSFDFRNADPSSEARLRAEAGRIKDETVSAVLELMQTDRRFLAATGRA